MPHSVSATALWPHFTQGVVCPAARRASLLREGISSLSFLFLFSPKEQMALVVQASDLMYFGAL